MPGQNRLGANALLSGATNLLLALLGMGTGILAARLLGPRGRGELAAIQTWPTFIGYLALLGTGDALVYHSARDPERAATYLGSAIVMDLLTAGPFMLVAFIALPWLLSAQSLAVVAGARWYLLIVPVLGMAGLPFYPLRGRGDFAAWNALRVTPTAVWMAILIMAWAVSCHRPSLLAYIYLGMLASLCLPVFWVVRKRLPGSFRPDSANFGPLLRYGLPCVMTTLPQVLNLRMDQMLMAAFLPPGVLGLYVVAVAWSGAINPLLNAVATVLFPEVASKESERERNATFIRGTRVAALLSVLGGSALMLATPWGIVGLFGAKFRAAVPQLILAPAATIAAMNQVLEDGLRGLGCPVAVMRAEMAGLVVTAIALALMLRPMGIVGAAIASLLGYSTVTLTLLLQACWLTGASPMALLVPRTGDLALYLKQARGLVRTVVALA